VTNDEVVRAALQTWSQFETLRDRCAREAGKQRALAHKLSGRESMQAWSHRCILHGMALAYNDVAMTIKTNLASSTQAKIAAGAGRQRAES
jgi:hypothetical protein